MKTIQYCIQCTDKVSNTVGCFAYDPAAFEMGEGFHAISPVFPSSIEFFKWADTQGYKSERSYSFTMVKP